MYEACKSTSFKPYYKWNTFNTEAEELAGDLKIYCFKPYYKWNTFNTIVTINARNKQGRF